MEVDVDSVGGADDVGWKIEPASLVHQQCPVSLRDCQVVVLAIGLHIEGGELDSYDEPLIHLYDVRPGQVIGVVGGVSGGAQDNWYSWEQMLIFS